MARTRRTRRSFLTSLASTAALAPLAMRLSGVESAFASELDSVLGGRGALEPPESLRARYLLDDSVVYLNHASIGTMPRAVHDARAEYSAICESNPHLYIWGDAWERLWAEVRGKAARFLGVDSDEVSITHNTTEGFNTLAYGLPLGPGDEVLFSSLNHGGASIPWEHAAEARGYTVRRFDFPVADIPGMSEADVVRAHAEAIRPETRVLVFPHVDNIVGLRHPMGPLQRMARDAGVEFVAVDGAQAVGMIPIDVGASGIDFYSASPHKWLQSPKGLGLFFVRHDLRETLRPMWVRYGLRRWNGTPRMYEDYGTRNSPEVMALGDAMDFQDALGTSEKDSRYRRLRQAMKERVNAAPGLRWNSPIDDERGAILVSIGFRRASANELSRELYEEAGIVLRSFETAPLNAFRVSPNTMTTDEELDLLFRRLETLG